MKIIDLNLFYVFDAIYTTGSVKSAAEKLNVSPPAISHSLGKLRDIYKDPLFVRDGKGLKRTVFADGLHIKIKESLSLLVNSQNLLVDFDIKKDNKIFKIGTDSDLDLLFYNKLLKNTKDFNNIKIIKENNLLNDDDIKNALRLRNVDLIITSTPIKEMSYINKEVKNEDIVAVVRIDHPRIKNSLSKEQFFYEEHSGWTGLRDNQKTLESLMIEKNEHRNVVYNNTSNLNLLYMTMEQDWITISSKTFFNLVNTNKKLKSFPIPFNTNKLPFYITYHKSFENDKGIQWLITEIEKSFL